MNMIKTIFLALSSFMLTGCTNAGDDKKNSDPANSFPNYRLINAPSSDPDMPWYISSFFEREKQWKFEASVSLNTLKLGMYELTQYPYQGPTQAQEDSASKLIQDSFDVVERHGWLNKEKALSDGYEKMYGDPVHFVNTDYVFDGETLNPEKPEVLMYYRTREGDFLMGVMFLAIGERGPQAAGPLTVWHYHIDRRMCYERGVLPIDTIEDGKSCGQGVPNIRSPEMLHVWFFDHPDGRFATTMGLSEELLNSGIKQIIEFRAERN
ncbi:MAG: hypothetical protein ACR2Q3_15645 [Woeseiaceae bacterium]